jgi:hypothetical protein
VFLGTFNAAKMFCYPSPDLCLDTIMSRCSTDKSFDLMACFYSEPVLSSVGPYIDRCGPFQIMSNQLNLSHMDSNKVIETSMMINGNRIHLSSIFIAKDLNTYVNKVC